MYDQKNYVKVNRNTSDRWMTGQAPDVVDDHVKESTCKRETSNKREKIRISTEGTITYAGAASHFWAAKGRKRKIKPLENA